MTFATPGPLGFYRGEFANGPPTLGMTTYPVPFEHYRPFFTEGAVLAVAGFQASDFADILPPNVKHRSRLGWHIAQNRLIDPESDSHCEIPGAIPVVFSHCGVGDTAIGAILVVSDGVVFRTELGTALDSLSMRVVSELCTSLGVPFETEPLDMRGLALPTIQNPASEILLAGTGFCIAGVRRFANGKESRLSPGPGRCTADCSQRGANSSEWTSRDSSRGLEHSQPDVISRVRQLGSAGFSRQWWTVHRDWSIFTTLIRLPKTVSTGMNRTG